MNNEFYEEFSKLSDKDRKEVLDLMQYKIHIDNKNFKNRVEYLENIIEGLESDVRVLGEHIEDDCTAHEEAIKWCVEAHELAIENKELKENYERIYNENCILREKHNINDIVLLDENYKLKQVIDKAIEYIENDLSHVKVVGKRNRSYLLEILRGED